MSKKLFEIAKITDSLHQTPSYVASGIPMVRVTDIKNGELLFGNCLKVTEEDYRRFTTNHTPQKGDIVISRVGTYGCFAYVKEENSFCLGQNTAIISPKENSRFLYYYLISDYVKQQIERKVVGSTQKTISLKSIKDLEVPDFTVNTQNRIAGFLGSIDDKIECNTLINENLLQQATVVFNKFYNASPNEQSFTPLISVLGGGTPKTDNPEFWAGTIPFFTPKDVGLPYTFQTEKYITESGLSHCNSRLYPQNTTFLTARGTVGKVSLAGTPMAMNQSCYALASETINPLLVYFYTLKAVESLKLKASGAVFDAIVTRDFDTETINILSDEDSQSVISIISPMMEAIHNNSRENMRLTALRDALLPKLMSGELDISGLDI